MLFVQHNSRHDVVYVNNFMNYTIGDGKRKLSLYASHDSMLMPLLVSLGCYDWVWPGYASNIAYELWKHKTTGRFWAKILYNGKVSSGCQTLHF